MGAGGLGSRHLQGVATLDRPLRVHAVDPSDTAVATARQRLDEVGPSAAVSVEFHPPSDPLPEHVDVAIVATSSKPRRSAVEHLLDSSSVDSLVLEKFLFPVPGDYAAVSDLLDATGTTAWVNCPRRLWPGYRSIAASLPDGADVHVQATLGERSGIGTVAIHFVDLLAYLTRTTDVAVDVAGLDSEVKPAARPGYVEFTGSLDAAAPAGSHLHLESVAGRPAGVDVVIEAGAHRWTIDEIACVAEVDRGEGRGEEPFEVPFQSALTGPLVEALLDTGTCDLTPYAESKALHLAVLEPLIDRYRTLHDPEATGCPIT